MLVKNVMNIARLGPLSNIAMAKNDEALMQFIYLGVSELYRRFNLKIDVETIKTNPDLALYELRNKDVSLLLNIYDSKGKELRQTDVLGGDFDYKIMNYKSFLFKNPRYDLLFAVYKACPPQIESIDDEIVLPDAMIDALLTYVAYLGHSSVNRDNINEASAYDKRFMIACAELENQGYKIPINSESINLKIKGYV